MRLSPELLARLPDHSILRCLADHELAALLTHAIKRGLAKGEHLFNEGDPGDSMMVVLSGTLKAFTFGAHGREIVFDYLGAGEVVGEIAVLDGKPRTAHVVAVEPAELVVLQRRFLLPQLERNVSASLKLVEILCARLRRTNTQMADNAALAMGPKLARGLLRLAAQHGVEREGAVGLRFPINQSELGNYVALSRENVNRQLRDWAADGLIEMGRNRITILDEGALQAIGDGLG